MCNPEAVYTDGQGTPISLRYHSLFEPGFLADSLTFHDSSFDVEKAKLGLEGQAADIPCIMVPKPICDLILIGRFSSLLACASWHKCRHSI